MWLESSSPLNPHYIFQNRPDNGILTRFRGFELSSFRAFEAEVSRTRFGAFELSRPRLRDFEVPTFRGSEVSRFSGFRGFEAPRFRGFEVSTFSPFSGNLLSGLISSIFRFRPVHTTPTSNPYSIGSQFACHFALLLDCCRPEALNPKPIALTPKPYPTPDCTLQIPFHELFTLSV